MKLHVFSMLLLFGFLSSLQTFADCEADIGLFQVQFPQGDTTQISFTLLNKYEQMTLISFDRDLTDPVTKAKYDLLYEAGYTQGLIRFGVTTDVCQHLEEYRLPIGFGGSWTNLPITKVVGLKRVCE